MSAANVTNSVNPRVSVIMTTFNGASLIPATIEGILGQTFEDFEFLIIDDGSTDNTVDVIQRYDDKRIRFLPNDRNLGISISRNRAMSLSLGAFLAPTDQDDISRPERLARQIEYLESHPDAAIVSAGVILQCGSKSWSDPSPTFVDPLLVHMGLFFGRHNVTYSTLCMRLDFLRHHNLEFRQEFHYAEDFEFYHRAAKLGHIVTLPEELVVSRIHGKNTSRVCGKDMAANGKRFMAQAYSDLLGCNVDSKDIDIIWRLVVEKHPANSLDELQHAGRLIEAAAEAFERCHSAGDTAALHEFVSSVWWSVVRAGSGLLGPSALKLYRSFPAISNFGPPRGEHMRSLISAAIPPQVRAMLRNARGRR